MGVSTTRTLDTRASRQPHSVVAHQTVLQVDDVERSQFTHHPEQHARAEAPGGRFRQPGSRGTGSRVRPRTAGGRFRGRAQVRTALDALRGHQPAVDSCSCLGDQSVHGGRGRTAEVAVERRRDPEDTGPAVRFRSPRQFLSRPAASRRIGGFLETGREQRERVGPGKPLAEALLRAPCVDQYANVSTRSKSGSSSAASASSSTPVPDHVVLDRVAGGLFAEPPETSRRTRVFSPREHSSLGQTAS